MGGKNGKMDRDSSGGKCGDICNRKRRVFVGVTYSGDGH